MLLYSYSKGNTLASTVRQGARKENIMEDMTRLELLTVLLSIQALLESDKVEEAKKVIAEVIEEARKN